jgi:hypothetical protein
VSWFPPRADFDKSDQSQVWASNVRFGPLVVGIVIPGDHPSYLDVRGKKATLERTYPHVNKKEERDASHPPPKTTRFGRPDEKKAERDGEIKNATQDRDVSLIPHDFSFAWGKDTLSDNDFRIV